ncbi:hypothetical protein AgCh_025484 [Apium graveolens]
MGEESSANDHHITPLLVTDCGAKQNFFTTSREHPKSSNLIVSPSLINSPVKVDQIETGLKALNSGDTYKLSSCTDTLRFESCHEKSVKNDFENSAKSRAIDIWRKYDTKNKGIKNKTVPPPLSSFDANGKPTFFLHPVRNNGRLKLIEVKINRPEGLHALGEYGQHRLYPVESNDKSSDLITSTDVAEERISDNKDKRIAKELKFPVSRGGGEDCQLLKEMASNHLQQQHNMHGWDINESASGEELVRADIEDWTDDEIIPMTSQHPLRMTVSDEAASPAQDASVSQDVSDTQDASPLSLTNCDWIDGWIKLMIGIVVIVNWIVVIELTSMDASTVEKNMDDSEVPQSKVRAKTTAMADLDFPVSFDRLELPVRGSSSSLRLDLHLVPPPALMVGRTTTNSYSKDNQCYGETLCQNDEESGGMPPNHALYAIW